MEIAVIAAGAMGSAVARRLTNAGCTVLTNLDGRSEATRRRAKDAGMHDLPLPYIASRARFVLSILPPSDAFSFAQKFHDASAAASTPNPNKSVIFADCNAVNPVTVKRIASIFSPSQSIRFVDAGIIGGPPNGDYDPTFYASASADDTGVLDAFLSLSKYGMKISPLTGEGVGIGDASALKMSYAGITKGITGLFTTMILAAHASSPTTSSALLHELHASQPSLLNRITTTVPPMLPKAYRWVGEMEEIAGFVGGEGPVSGTEGEIYQGLARLYERIERSVDDNKTGGDVDTLKNFVDEAKKVIKEQ